MVKTKLNAQELEAKGRLLSEKHERNLKQYYLCALVTLFTKLQLQKQLYQNLSEYIKFKGTERMKRNGLKALINNWLVNRFRRHHINRIRGGVFLALTASVGRRKKLKADLKQYKAAKLKTILLRGFDTLRRGYIGYRNKCRMADSQYQSTPY